MPLYTNLLALEDDEGIAIGVINMPALGETVYAARGLGCCCNGAPARVNDTASARRLLPEQQRPEPLGRRRPAPGQAGRHASCAPGATATATRSSPPAGWRPCSTRSPPSTTWRRCRSSCAEAGGRFSDLGGTNDPGGGSGLATNGHLHDELLALLVD